MSIKDTLSFVQSFVQSDACKLSCGNFTGEVTYQLSGIVGEELPIRSCGCFAQRVLDRTHIKKKDRNQCKVSCYTWYFALVRCQLGNREFLSHNCFNCLQSAFELPLASIVDSSEGHYTKEEYELNDGVIPWDISPTGLKSKYLRLAKIKLGPPAPHIPWVSNQLPYAFLDNTDVCGHCDRSLIVEISQDECADCYMRRLPVPVEEFNQDEFNEAIEDLDDLIISDEELEDMRNRDMSTPEPNIEPFNIAAVSPIDFDMSDDEQRELDEYMRAMGFF